MPHPASSYARGIKKCNTFVALRIGGEHREFSWTFGRKEQETGANGGLGGYKWPVASEQSQVNPIPLTTSHCPLATVLTPSLPPPPARSQRLRSRLRP